MFILEHLVHNEIPGFGQLEILLHFPIPQLDSNGRKEVLMAI